MGKARPIATQIERRILKHPLFYVCREIERAVGTDLDLPNYFIITNHSPLSVKLAKKYYNITILKNIKPLDTWELLKHPRTKKIIKKNNYVLVFKNTPQIEELYRERGWKLLNPGAKLASEVEEKISQIKWLGPLKKYLPKYKVTICKKISWTGKKFILQFNRSHTGSGTTLVENKKQLADIQKKFPQREARVAEYISGPLFTNNNVVWGNKILLGNINYQITGLKPFTDLPFATIGNDWALPHKILSPKQIKQYNKIATEVGQRLKKSGWKGLFGIDAVMNQKTGRLYLLEINARQPASTTYESQLQQHCHSERSEESLGVRSLRDPSVAKLPQDDNWCTTFEAHLASLLGVSPDKYKLIEIKDGAQIIQRVSDKTTNREPRTANLTKLGLNVIAYNNIELNSDLFRIQSREGIMSGHNKFNKLGQKILCCL